MDETVTTYASVQDVQARTSQVYSPAEQDTIETLLQDAAAMIDAYRADAAAEMKKIVSCRMVIRAMGGDAVSSLPLGATQGSMTAGPYTQSWTLSGGALGELYLGKTERAMLGGGNRIGSYSPVEGLVVSCD